MAISLRSNLSNGSMRINTSASSARTSSNKSFNDQFRSGLKSSVDLGNNMVGKLGRNIPGGAMLSASLSDASRNLGGPSSLSGVVDSPQTGTLDASGEPLESQMKKENHNYLEQQMRISRMSTAFSTQSNIMKVMFDTLKTIGSNIR